MKAFITQDQRRRGKTWTLAQLMDATNKKLALAQHDMVVSMPTIKQHSRAGRFEAFTLNDATDWLFQRTLDLRTSGHRRAKQAHSNADRQALAAQEAPMTSQAVNNQLADLSRQVADLSSMLRTALSDIQQYLGRLVQAPAPAIASRDTHTSQQLTLPADLATLLSKLNSHLSGLDDARKLVLRQQDALAQRQPGSPAISAAAADQEATLNLARIAKRLGSIEELMQRMPTQQI